MIYTEGSNNMGNDIANTPGRQSDMSMRALPSPGSIVSVTYSDTSASPRMAAAMKLAGRTVTAGRAIGVVLESPSDDRMGKLKLKSIDGRELSIPASNITRTALTHAVTSQSRRLLRGYYEWYVEDRRLQSEMESIAARREKLRMSRIASFDAFIATAQSTLSASQFAGAVSDKLSDIMPGVAADHYSVEMSRRAVELVRTVELHRFYDGPLVEKGADGKFSLVAGAEDTEEGQELLASCRRELGTRFPLYECFVLGPKDTLTYVGMYIMREISDNERLTDELASEIAEEFAL